MTLDKTPLHLAADGKQDPVWLGLKVSEVSGLLGLQKSGINPPAFTRNVLSTCRVDLCGSSPSLSEP